MKNLCISSEDEKIINMHNDDYTLLRVDENIVVGLQLSKKILQGNYLAFGTKLLSFALAHIETSTTCKQIPPFL
jgi:hypothetical protein